MEMYGYPLITHLFTTEAFYLATLEIYALKPLYMRAKIIRILALSDLVAIMAGYPYMIETITNGLMQLGYIAIKLCLHR